MKKIISMTLLLTSFSLASCEGIHNKIWSNNLNPEPIGYTRDSPSAATASTPNHINITEETADGKPKFAVIKSMIQGDSKCYVVLVDGKGVDRELGATSDICTQGEKFLSKKVNLTYETFKVDDCQGNEPCEQTKNESLIVQMDVLDSTSTAHNNSPDVVTLTNGKWIVTIGDRNSWNGVNGTGNLTYYGCNSGGKCIKLRGGKVNCSQGECTITWRNGNQDYTVKGKITPGNREAFMSPSTLIIRQSNQVIARAEGLRPLN